MALGLPTTRESRKTALGAAVEVEADEVPAAVPGDDAPGLHVPAGGRVLVGALVVELQRPAVAGGGVAGLERRLAGVQARLQRDGAGGVDVDAGRLAA